MMSVSEIDHANYSLKSQHTAVLKPFGRPDMVPVANPPTTTATTMNDRPNWVTLGPEQPVWTATYRTSRTVGSDLSGHRYLDRVVSKGTVVKFDKGLGLKVDIRFQGGKYIASDPQFGIYGFGTTFAEALQDFSDFFVEFYLDIVESDEDELAESTLEFKKTFLAFATLKQRG